MHARWILAITATSLAALTAVRGSETATPTSTRIATAARTFLLALDEEQRATATFDFDAAEREKWHFVPGRYPGLELGAMTTAQRRNAHALLEATLSSAGYLKTTTIVQLETELRRAAEAAGRQADHRDPERYAFALFGKPSNDAPWGFRVQGHHLSLNFTSIGGRIIVTTPAFLGSNPAEIRSGPHRGLRVLGTEEDRARELLASLTDAQREAVRIADTAPRDVILGPDAGTDRLGDPRGVRFATLTAEQRAMLWELIAEYANNLERDLARAQLERIADAGKDAIRFAWAGSFERGEPHYFRVHGPTFAIEYDNVQNGANHVHTVWRDLENDFGGDLLRAHHEAGHRRDRDR